MGISELTYAEAKHLNPNFSCSLPDFHKQYSQQFTHLLGRNSRNLLWFLSLYVSISIISSSLNLLCLQLNHIWWLPPYPSHHHHLHSSIQLFLIPFFLVLLNYSLETSQWPFLKTWFNYVTHLFKSFQWFPWNRILSRISLPWPLKLHNLTNSPHSPYPHPFHCLLSVSVRYQAFSGL